MLVGLTGLSALGASCRSSESLTIGSDRTTSAITIDPTKLDILIVMDNSASMREEQATFAVNLQEVLAMLMRGDRDGDLSTTDDQFAPIGDVHIGVVTTDMGAAGAAIQTCSEDGDDAELLMTVGDGAEGECATTYASHLSYDADDAGSSMEEFAAAAACSVHAGTNGCGFEQQLEATLKAITPADSPIRFFDDSLGNGAGGSNDGFLRDDSNVLVVVVSDEDDCSLADPSLVDGSNPDVNAVNFNLRCGTFGELLHPVTRYVDGLKALRPGNEDAIKFVAVVGMPVDLEPSAGTLPDYEAILADPRMAFVADEENPAYARPACSTSAGFAIPGRRIIEVARGFGSHGRVASICQSNLANTIVSAL